MPSSSSTCRSGRGTACASNCWRAATREIAKQVPDEVAALSDAQIEVLGEDYNTPIHLRAAPEVAGRAVNERADRAALTAQFEEQGAVAVDDLLTPPALDALRRFLLESTIWHDFSHIDGFVASYLEDGLACPLLLQIADELRRAFPEILGSASAVPGLGLQRACGRSRPSTSTPTMPPSASISGSRRRKPTSTPGAAAWSSAGRRRPTIGRSGTTTPTGSGS